MFVQHLHGLVVVADQPPVQKPIGFPTPLAMSLPLEPFGQEAQKPLNGLLLPREEIGLQSGHNAIQGLNEVHRKQ